VQNRQPQELEPGLSAAKSGIVLSMRRRRPGFR
jgi:hypothetical protein